MTTIPRTSGIYQILCVPTGKVYIGSSVDLAHRKGQHWASLSFGKHENSYLQNAWNKYGADAFAFTVVELCERDQLIEREQSWIDSTRCFERDRGFNRRIYADSNTGVRKTPAARENIRAALRRIGKPFQLFTPEAREKHRVSQAARRGQRFTDEHRAALSNAKLGKARKPEHAAHFGRMMKQQLDALSPDDRARRVAKKSRDYIFVLTAPDGSEYRVFNLTAFCLEHKLDRSGFTRLMQGKKTSYKGWTCRRGPDDKAFD